MKRFSKTEGLNWGPLDLKPDTLPTEPSSLGIYVSKMENILHGYHFHSLEIVSTSWETRFPSYGNFFRGEKMPALLEMYIPSHEFVKL